MAKVLVCDYWKKFMPPVSNYWREQGHEVRVNMNWDPKDTAWADVAYFYPVQNNLRVASRKQEKPPGLRVVAEAVDIDIYSNNLNGINWSYVDALVFMAEHMRKVGMDKAGSKIPSDLPIYIVPGGVDLDTWTYRRDPSRGYNVAWVGRTWWVKGMFSAIQIFNQLVKENPGNPWKLFLRADGSWKPAFWKNHIDTYIEANDRLHDRIEFVPRQADMNEWLESIDFHILASVKESFSYITAECAAKGVKPLVQMTNGMDEVWPSSWIFQTHDEAIDMLLGDYDPQSYREFVGDTYPLSKRCRMLDEICEL